MTRRGLREDGTRMSETKTLYEGMAIVSTMQHSGIELGRGQRDCGVRPLAATLNSLYCQLRGRIYWGERNWVNPHSVCG